MPRRLASRGPLVGVFLLLLLASSAVPAAPVALSAPGAPDAPNSPVIAKTRTSAPLFTPGLRDPEAGLPGRWERELQRREALLAGRGARAILGLLGLFEELGGEVDEERLHRLLAGVADDRRHDPLVRAHATYLLGRLAEALGDRAGARARFTAAGFLLDWQLVGPFDNSGRAGHAAVYPPEIEPYSPGQNFTGKLPGEPLGWRPLTYEAIPRGAYVALDDRLHPNTQATGYATLWIEAPKASAAALHLATSGAFAVWLNGVAIGDGEVYRAAHPLQESLPLRLAPGLNRLLIKVSCDDGVWGFFARLSDPKGAPLAGVEVLAHPPAAAAGAAAAREPEVAATTTASAKQPAIRSLRGLLTAAASRPRVSAEALLDLVAFERLIHPYAPGDRQAVERARAADEAAATAYSAWLRASADPDPAGHRQALLEGIARARAEVAAEGSRSPGKRGKVGTPRARDLLAQMLVELAWQERALGFDRRFRERVDEARAIVPDDAEIELIAAAGLADDGFPLTTLAWVDDLLRRFPESALIRREKAERLLDLGRTREGLGILRDLRGGLGRDDGLAYRTLEAHLRLGEIDRARALALARVRAAPGLPDAHRELAKLEEAAGDLDAAIAALLEASRLAPQDAELHAAVGRLHARRGEIPAALRALQRSLDLRPQQPELRDLMATLEPSAGDDLFARYDVDFAALAAQPTPDTWAGKSAGVLHRRIAVRVLANGLSERLDHRIIRILDDRGVRGQAVQAIAYDPAESYVDIRRARVRRADGTIAETGAASVIPLTEAGFRMYYDQRAQRVEFRGLAVGDVLEVAFLQRDVAARNKFDDYFGDLVTIDSADPQRVVEVIYEAPASRPLHFNRPVETTPSADGATLTYRYRAEDRPGLRLEAHMPGWAEVADYLHVSTFADWDAVGRWYWGLVREQLVVDSKIRAGVAEALRGLPAAATPAEKVAAIYTHVIESTRYVGLEFGIHGYKPYRTTDVYDRRFGDCKDKASLLKVMLAEAGIASELTLVRTRDQGVLDAKPASLAAFNHAIVYVPSLDLYLDGTAEFSGPGELPLGDQGAMVLRIRDGEGAALRTTPIAPASANTTTITQKIALASDGSARIDHQVTVHGAQASAWRRRLQAAPRRREQLAQIWGRTYPGVEVQSLDTPGITEVRRPVAITATLAVPRLAQDEGGRLRLPVVGYRPAVVRGLAPQAKREHDLVLTSPAVEEQTLSLRLPPGFTFAAVPPGAKIVGDHGAFILEVDARGDRATVRFRLEYTSPRIPAAEYPAFREFLREVDASLGGTLEIARASETRRR